MGRKRIPLFGDDKATQLLAKGLVWEAFRGSLEFFHGGTFPLSKTGDYSDVKVVSPFEEIPWAELNRVSQEEMEGLVKTVLRKVFTLLASLDDHELQAALIAIGQGGTLSWEAPSMDEELIMACKSLLHDTSSRQRAQIASIIVEGAQKRELKFRRKRV